MKRKFTTLFAILLCVVAGQAQWSLTGNAGTDPNFNFIGTTDDQPLVFRTHNTWAGILDKKLYNTSFGPESFLYAIYGYGSHITAVGYQALAFNANGVQNTGIGSWALRDNTTGSDNTSVGYGALVNNETGHGNTAVGSVSQSNSVETSFNSSLGSFSLLNCANGANYNTSLGVGADFNTLANYSNSTMLGSNAKATASNQVRIGSTSVTSIGGIVDWTTLSDGRFKSNIQSNVPGLAFIKQLKPVTYTLKVSELNNYLHPNGITDLDGKKIDIPEPNTDITAGEKIVYTGFIAQHVAEAAEKAGYDFHGVDKPKNDKDLYGLRYAEFVTPLVQAVQELSNTNDSLKTQINNLQSQINDMMLLINNLKNNTTTLNSALPVLKQNNPNPFNSNTIIGYFLPSTTKHAQLIVSAVNGQLLKTISLNSNGEGQAIIHSGELAAGSYFYTLVADGKRVDTKQMILTR